MTQASGDLSWFALRTMPMREDMVRKLLIYRGLKAFIKTERRARRKTRFDAKRRERDFVVAGGYVFVGLNNENPWSLTHNCHMIRSVVSLNGRPAHLNHEALADFLGFDDYNLPDFALYFKSRDPGFAIGDNCRIESPSFDGFVLPVKDIQRGEAVFSLVMMGRETEIRDPLEQVYKAA